jgi:hypothetical protein
MLERALEFIQTVGVPNAMAIYLIWYYGKKIDRMVVLLTALAVHQGVFQQEKTS